jgi:2-succinyl-6-hydroxy-2,4-cyclohexadiene-1-carboxylate synthase
MAPALVLLHGFTNTGACWGPVIDAVGQRYRALAPDLRGHGSATETAPVTLEAVIGDVAGLTDGPFALAGYSQGGRIALHVALALPERVTRLTLIGAGPGIADDAERAARRAADDRLADELDTLDRDGQAALAAFAERWARTPLLTGLSPDIATAAHADRLRNRPAGLARALRGLGTGALPPLWDRLAELRMPTALIVGERDDKFRAIAEAMAAGSSSATVHVVPGAGHAVHLERPAAVAALLRA